MGRARFSGKKGSFEPSCEVGYGSDYFLKNLDVTIDITTAGRYILPIR